MYSNRVPLEKVSIKKELPKDLLPLSTIKVTWSSNRTRTIYKPESLYAYLTRFGPIDAVYPKSVNSAYVVFSDLEAAKACIQCTDLGRPWDPLFAFWAEPRMYNSSFYYKYATAENLPIRVRM
ncbi:unnamed protein product [Candidula unifasciata]|uniref:RRM domain-containing protein n=1 Tax=Candidula unifasciata TaxID=100452 RepID=A0A8S3ZYJ1_9EUPU|nr:unnamed protein product [Candidula unifasciata]